MPADARAGIVKAPTNAIVSIPAKNEGSCFFTDGTSLFLFAQIIPHKEEPVKAMVVLNAEELAFYNGGGAFLQHEFWERLLVYSTNFFST